MHLKTEKVANMLKFIRQKGGTVLIHGGYQYIKHKQYVNNTARWICINKKKDHCAGAVLIDDVLKKMRTLDDKIVYALNTSIPTESFLSKMDATSTCADLYSQIQGSHTERDHLIKNCIVTTAESVKNLKVLKEQNPNDLEVTKNLRAEQTKLRLLRSELSVEEVIKEKTTKLFTEKCRLFYKPSTVL